MAMDWFILQFKPNSHNIAIKNLNRQGFETFLPLQNLTERKASKFKNISRPLFPGYMFVKFDQTKPFWSKINNTHGVSSLVSFNSILKSVPIKFINELMERYDVSGRLLPSGELRKGDIVKVSNGPFSNFIATIETLEADQRIWILTDLMGRKTKVETKVSHLQFKT